MPAETNSPPGQQHRRATRIAKPKSQPPPSTAEISSADPPGRLPPWRGYGTDWPLGGYGVLLAAFGAAYAALLVAAGERHLPQDMSARDLARLAVATHKIGRILTMDWVTIPIRAPFVRFGQDLQHGEVHDKARGTGLRSAVGQLLTCPWCIAPWVAGTLAAGLVWRPRTTRWVLSVFTAVAISDTLQHGYNRLRGLSP